MKKFYIILLALVAFFACDPEKQRLEKDKPKDLIEGAKMQKVMIDMLTVDAYLSAHQVPLFEDTARRVSEKFYQEIFKREDINREQFKRSMDYYGRHPELLEGQLQPVIDSLSAMEARLH